MKKSTPGLVFLDIETIPTQSINLQTYALDLIKAPGNYKDPVKIAEYIAEAKDNAIDKLALDGALNHIICIGVAIDNHPAITFHTDKAERENHIIELFFDYLEENLPRSGNTFIGHNIHGFDMKVLKQRAMILELVPDIFMPWNVRPWDSALFDTMSMWDAKEYTKLDKIAKVMSIGGKSFDAANVYKDWKNGLIEMIANNCKSDVELTRKVYKRMLHFV